VPRAHPDQSVNQSKGIVMFSQEVEHGDTSSSDRQLIRKPSAKEVAGTTAGSLTKGT
jgi:hypothetical protein